jgi:hypothetical protein
MRQVITASIVLVAVIGGLVQAAFATPTSCEKNYQKCMDNTPWGQTTAPCLRAVLKCEADARNNPDAITSAGPRVPRGEKPGKGPGKNGTKLTSSGNMTNNAGTLASTPAAIKPAGVATSGAAASGAAMNNANRTAGKPEPVPSQLAERLRRLQR